MESVETRRQAKISQLDVTTTVQKNVVGLDVTVSESVRFQGGYRGIGVAHTDG